MLRRIPIGRKNGGNGNNTKKNLKKRIKITNPQNKTKSDERAANGIGF